MSENESFTETANNDTVSSIPEETEEINIRSEDSEPQEEFSETESEYNFENPQTNTQNTGYYGQPYYNPSVAVVRDAEEVRAENEIITPEKTYKKTLRGIFLILCTFPILSIIAVLPILVYGLLSYTSGSSGIEADNMYYIMSFALPQFIYPILTVLASVFMAVAAKRKVKDTVKIANAPAIDSLLAVGAFLGIGTVGSYIAEYITEFIINMGVPVPDMEEYIPTPQSPLQFALYLIVIAIMPALCEEFVFRGVICGLIKEYNKTAAIILSALAFSLVHATVQQIPFAFLMGLFLGYLYVKYETLLIGIILHFINNFISCIFSVLYGNIPEETYTVLYTVYDIATVVIGIVCLVIFIVRRIRERKENPEKQIAPVHGGKLVGATLSSWAMWLFIAVYMLETAGNILLMAY